MKILTLINKPMENLKKETPTKENTFLDLSKLSEEQRKSLPRILRESGELIYDITENMLNSGGLIDKDGDDDFILLSKLKNEWVGYLKSGCDEKTELTYPEFIKLFEGGEGETELEVWKSVANELAQALKGLYYMIGCDVKCGYNGTNYLTATDVLEKYKNINSK